ncbi:MAG: hypothetical protein DRN04_06650 [Thermoprotei archaeon]|nr:MAG: hypothetical protein DRN04_06650 [Thermoprotei archaeon]
MQRSKLLLAALALIGVLVLSLLVYRAYLLKQSEKKLEEELYEVLNELKNIKPRKPIQVELKGKAVWCWGTTITKYGPERIVNTCKSLGIKHIFVLVKGVSGTVVKNVIAEILPLAHKNGIYVHAWTVCFVDESNPGASPDSYEYRKYLLKVLAEFLLLNASGEYVDGIHLDYIRYGGMAENKWKQVSSFVYEVRVLIDKYAPGVVLSIASKAEDYTSPKSLAASALYYGQNYTDLAKYVDLFCPMTYYLDYGVSPREAMIGAKWVKDLTGKPVFAGIQLHPVDSLKPTVNEIKNSLDTCIEEKLDGIIFFKMHHLMERLDELGPLIAEYSFEP